MGDLGEDLDRLARDGEFSGVVRVDRAGAVELAVAYGLADRAHGIPVTVDTRFGIASGVKGLTAVTVMSLVHDGTLSLATPARRLLRDDLPLIDDDVTVEHLLAHRSGIGDYLDESAGAPLEAYALPVPVQHLATSEDYLAVLDGHPQRFPAGTAFSYCNGGYVVLAIIAERATGTPFAELVRARACEPAGMARTEFLRSDELPGDAALGYVTMDGVVRSNVFHLPVRGSGDGGIYATAADVAAFWRALHAGTVVPADLVAEMVRPRSRDAESGMRYGLGFWRHPTSDVVLLEGADAGVSFRSVHDPVGDVTHTVLSNTTHGAWAITRLLGGRLGTAWR